MADVLERADLWPLTGRIEAGAVLEGVTGETAAGMTTLEVEGQRLRVPAIDVAAGAPVRLRVQARDVALATQRPENLSIRNVLSARVLSVDLDESVFAELLLDLRATVIASVIPTRVSCSAGRPCTAAARGASPPDPLSPCPAPRDCPDRVVTSGRMES